MLYLCTRYHAVLALRGGEGVGAIFYWYSVLQRIGFGHLNVGTSSYQTKANAEWMLRTWLYTPRQCAERLL
jgi:hypothetical protein